MRTFAPEDVTSISEHEVPARQVGLSRQAVDTIWRSVVSYYKFGLQPSLALCVRYRGQIVIDRTIGHARGNGPDSDGPLVKATPDTLYNLFSGSKSITAMLIHMLETRGHLSIDDPVARYIPEFARHGKHQVTLRHLLAHRAGLAEAPENAVDPALLDDSDAIISLLCDMKPSTTPGKTQAYHALTGGFLLGEIAQRATGRTLQSILQDEVRTPLGFENLGYGVPQDKLHLVAEESFTGPRPRRPFRTMLGRSLGVNIMDVIDIANDPRFLTGVVPSGNIIGRAREICRFFELLLRGGTLDGVRVFEKRTIARATAPAAAREIDRVIMLPIRYGLGFMLGSRHLSFYGPRSGRAYGHLGFTNVLAWADPDREMSVALMNNGKPFLTPELVLWLNITRTIADQIPRI